MPRFGDKVVLVTGGSRGLGRSMVQGFAGEGAKLVIASRKEENCVALAAEIEDAGGRAIGVGANTANTADLDALVEKAITAFGRVDLLINNAGNNISYGPLTDLSVEQFDKMIAINLRGPWYLASKMAPIMAEQGGGAVINILSVAALRASAYNGFYAAAKSGLEVLTKVMAQEWADKNIRVNAIAPGPYRSDLVQSSIDNMPGFEQGMRDSTLLKRIAEADEILNPVFYLATEKNTTGITLVADGGYLANSNL